MSFVIFSNKPRGGGSFATSAYSVIPELSCHHRPMVRKGKSLLFGHISRKKTGGGTATIVVIAICRKKKKNLPPIF